MRHEPDRGSNRLVTATAIASLVAGSTLGPFALGMGADPAHTGTASLGLLASVVLIVAPIVHLVARATAAIAPRASRPAPGAAGGPSRES